MAKSDNKNDINIFDYAGTVSYISVSLLFLRARRPLFSCRSCKMIFCEYVIISSIHDYIYKARSNIEKALYLNIQIVLKMSPPPQHAKMLFSPFNIQ